MCGVEISTGETIRTSEVVRVEQARDCMVTTRSGTKYAVIGPPAQYYLDAVARHRNEWNAGAIADHIVEVVFLSR